MCVCVCLFSGSGGRRGKIAGLTKIADCITKPFFLSSTMGQQKINGTQHCNATKPCFTITYFGIKL